MPDTVSFFMVNAFIAMWFRKYITSSLTLDFGSNINLPFWNNLVYKDVDWFKKKKMIKELGEEETQQKDLGRNPWRWCWEWLGFGGLGLWQSTSPSLCIPGPWAPTPVIPHTQVSTIIPALVSPTFSRTCWAALPPGLCMCSSHSPDGTGHLQDFLQDC